MIIEDKYSANLVQEVLDGADPGNLMFAFRFLDTVEGSNYWHEQAGADAITDDARAKLEEMLKLYAK